MDYAIDRTDVTATIIASTRRRVRWREIGSTVIPLLDTVYAFIKASGITVSGHNVCVYHAPSADGVELACGVQVARRFEPSGAIRCEATPAGAALHTVHWGEYAELGRASDALIAYAKAHGLALREPMWELYGDWSDEPAQRRTDVYAPLA